MIVNKQRPWFEIVCFNWVYCSPIKRLTITQLKDVKGGGGEKKGEKQLD
jgi:hypothetical protein